MPILSIQPEWMLGDTPQVINGQLSSGISGNYETVDLMKKVARARSRHPLVRQLALQILHHYQIPSQHYLDEAKAIGRYVQQKVRYVRDIQGVETLHDPLTLIDQIRKGSAQADCDDMALLIAALLLSIGHRPYFRMVKYKPEMPGFAHIYVVDYEKNHGDSGKKRVVLDAILKRSPIGTEVPHASGKEEAV